MNFGRSVAFRGTGSPYAILLEYTQGGEIEYNSLSDCSSETETSSKFFFLIYASQFQLHRFYLFPPFPAIYFAANLGDGDTGQIKFIMYII
jgi:hypothetical protein